MLNTARRSNDAVTGGAPVSASKDAVAQQGSRPRESARFFPTQRFIALPESPLEGVSDDVWQRFAAALEVQSINAVSQSGGFGSYDLRPRRLVELGYAMRLRSKRTDKGRQIYICDFFLPWTQARFLADPVAQYTALSKSISLYHRAVLSGELKKPDGVSMAETMATLHRGGRGALEAWPKLFDHTRALCESVRGLF